MKKSIAVLGLGKFGQSLVRTLNEMGADVLAADHNEAIVKEIAANCSEAVCADLTNEESLMALGLKDMDIVVVAVGRNLEASFYAVSVAKEQGVPLIVAKSTSSRMTSILRKLGADKVIMPEESSGSRVAVILASESVLDYFRVDEDLCMVEMKPHSDWAGRSVIDLDMRRKYKINVVAAKDADGKWRMIDPEEPLKEERELLVILDRKDLGMIR